MRYHIGFLGLLLGIFAVFSYLAINFNERDLVYFHGSGEDVGQFIGAFRKAHKPLIEINFSTLYGSGEQFQVLLPFLGGQKSGAVSPEAARTFDLNTQLQDIDAQAACEMDDSLTNDSGWVSFMGKMPAKAVFEKRNAVERFFATGVGDPDALLLPPLIDSSGASYAYLLWKWGPPRLREKEWVERHLSFFKPSELKELIAQYAIKNPEYATISRLTESEMEEVIRGSPLVLTSDYLLIKDQYQYGFSPLSYRIYDLREVRGELADGKYDLIVSSPNAFCLERTGNVCWTYSSRHAMAYLYRYSLAILVLIGTVFLIFLWLYLSRLYRKNQEQQRQRFALQVLSHEFRTPVSSMLLMADQLTRNPSRFEVADQDLITRLSTEIFRLQRIIEVSKDYLQVGSRGIRFNWVEIPSVNDWVSDIADEFSGEVRCELLEPDQGLVADPFWLRFILSNLLQNAFAHGKAPVVIRLGRDSGKINVTIEDQGECEFASLARMTEAFVKSGRSKGMGLGLNIVKFVVDEWKGDIRFSRNPTSFTLSVASSGAKG